MSEVGDAVELTYNTAPGSLVTLTWINTSTGETVYDKLPVPEILTGGGLPSGQYTVALTADEPGLYEARFASTGASTTVDSYFERFEDPAAMEPPFATLSEYEKLYGTLTAARQATARALIRQASSLIRDSYPKVDIRIASGKVKAKTLSLAVINMVVKVIRNPDGLQSQTTGPFSRSYSLEASSGLLLLSDDERTMLADAGLGETGGGKKNNRIGTARITANMAPPAHRRSWRRGSW